MRIISPTVSPHRNLADLDGPLSEIRENLGLSATSIVADITQYGAVGDGVTDDFQAIQDAVDAVSDAGGGMIYVPPVDVDGGKFYKITRHVTQKSNTIIYGGGIGSCIENTSTSSSPPIRDQIVFIWGAYEGAETSVGQNVEYETFYPCSAIVAGTNDISFINVSDAANMAEGDVTFIKNSVAGDDGNPAAATPQVHWQHQDVNEISDLDLATGKAKLTYPHYRSDSLAGGTATISSGTYDNGTGDVTLTMSAAHGLAVGTSIWIHTLTGTGAFASLKGVYFTTTGTTGSTIVYNAGVGAGASTITGGTIRYGVWMAKSSGTLTDDFGQPILIRKNVGLYNLQLRNYYKAGKGITSFGGVLNFHFQKILMIGSDAFAANCMERGVIKDIRAKLSSKIFDLATYSGNIVGENIIRDPHDLSTGYKFAISSGTYDNGTGDVTLTLTTSLDGKVAVGEDIELSDLTGTGAFASIVGDDYTARTGTTGTTLIVRADAGLGATTITGGRVDSGFMDTKCIIGQMVHGIRFDNLIINCGVDDAIGLSLGRLYDVILNDCTVIAMGATPTNAPVAISGGADFGADGLILNNMTVVANSPTYMITFDNEGAATPDMMNVIRGTRLIGNPINDGIEVDSGSKWLVIENNYIPNHTIRIVSTDPTVIVRNNVVKTQNYADRQALNTNLETKDANTVAMTYAVAASGAGRFGGWGFRAWGTATTDAGAATRYVKLMFDDTNIIELVLEAGMAGETWMIEAEVIMRGLTNAQSAWGTGRINDGTGPDSTQIMVSSTLAESTTSAKNFTLEYRIGSSDTRITLLGWEVMPFGHDVRAH